MTENTGRRVRLIYGICLAALTVFVGALFIARVWAVYDTPDLPRFSVERVKAHFEMIIAPFWLWVAVIVGGVVVWEIFPEKPVRPAAYADVSKTLSRLKRRLPENGQGMKNIEQQARIRMAAGLLCVAVCIAVAILSVVTLTEKEFTGHFENAFIGTNHPEAEKLVLALPWILAAFALCIGVVYYFEHSQKKELLLVKNEIAENAKKGVKVTPKADVVKTIEKLNARTKEKILLGVRIGFAVIGVALVIIGICNGGMHAVLLKAINLCEQCVGIG